MANEVALTADQIAPVFPELAEIYDGVAAEALTKGEAVYLVAASGTFGVADANASGKQQFRGIALNAAAAGQSVSILKRGHCYGFTVSSLSYDDPLYLSDTAGDLSTVAGTLSVNTGRVVPLSDRPNYTAVVYIDADWLRTWA